MTRAEILSHALFDTGGEIDGLKFGPLSQPCLVILKRRRNGLLTQSDRDQDDHEAVGEILFVLSRTREQRGAMFRDDATEWHLKVGEFMAGLGDDTLPKFRDEYLGPAMHALAMAMVESEQPGKSQPSRPTSRSSRKELAASGSTDLRKASERKTRSGMSQPAPRSNSSTPKQSATALASGGSTGPKRTPKGSPSSNGSLGKKS
jgi:hypothetical protein